MGEKDNDLSKLGGFVLLIVNVPHSLQVSKWSTCGPVDDAELLPVPQSMLLVLEWLEVFEVFELKDRSFACDCASD